ncbi:hypothetical protein B0T19DRAFT_420270 [Cercophora scortea]|uniref:Uncharacterized protein n=1 Tax=Cercophora scortea TaxID=314031 RepID=A0AAE0J120_9PEZI|nr:hypothetical protein B0T19DRAFT_420270 [Cercophora scortea]
MSQVGSHPYLGSAPLPAGSPPPTYTSAVPPPQQPTSPAAFQPQPQQQQTAAPAEQFQYQAAVPQPIPQQQPQVQQQQTHMPVPTPAPAPAPAVDQKFVAATPQAPEKGMQTAPGQPIYVMTPQGPMMMVPASQAQTPAVVHTTVVQPASGANAAAEGFIGGCCGACVGCCTACCCCAVM